MALKDAIRKLGNLIDDLTTVTVQTYSGSVTGILAASEVKPKANETSFQAILAAAKADGQIKLAFLSVHDLDGDALLFQAEDSGIATEKLAAAHNSAVTAGLQSRQAIIEMFKDLVGTAAPDPE